MAKHYAIKQVLFVVSDEKQQIIPVQVVEKLTRQTLDGDEIVYKIKDPKGENIYDLNKIKGQIFTDPYIVKDILKKRVLDSIEKMVDMSIKVAKQKFGFNENKGLQAVSKETEKNDDLELELNDGDQEENQIQDIYPVSNESAPTVEIVGENGVPQKVKVRKITMGAGEA